MTTSEAVVLVNELITCAALAERSYWRSHPHRVGKASIKALDRAALNVVRALTTNSALTIEEIRPSLPLFGG